MLHVLQAGARAEQRPIPAKGLTGPGYDGHTFWDAETFVLPVLTYTAHRATGDALCWPQATLDHARERARQLGLADATFPWRTIGGPASSAYWPAGTAALHVNADIADAVLRDQAAAEDEAFRGPGLELLIETARLWRSLGHHDSSGRFRIDGVTGPDEYSAIAAVGWWSGSGRPALMGHEWPLRSGPRHACAAAGESGRHTGRGRLRPRCGRRTAVRSGR